MRKKHFHIWRLICICFILATIGFFCVQGNLLIDFCSKIFVNASVLPQASYSKVLGEPQELVILGATATNKQYDGETDIEVEVNFSGVASGDDATVVCKGDVLSPDAGTQKYVALSDFTIMGEDSVNYSLPQDINISPVFVDILPREVDLIWRTEENYTYNGENRIATISAYYKDIQNKKVPVEVSVRGYQGNIEFVNEFKNAGTYTAKAMLSLSDSNYNPKDDDGNLELNLKINRAQPVIDVSSDRTFVYLEDGTFLYKNDLKVHDASICAKINNNEQTLIFENHKLTNVPEGVEINKKGGVFVKAYQSANYLETSLYYLIDVVKAESIIDISNVQTNFVYSGLEQTIDGAALNNTEQKLEYSNNVFTTVAEGLQINKKGGVYIYAEATDNYKHASVYVPINVEKKELDINKMPLKWGVTSFVYDGNMKEVKVSNFVDTILDVSYKNERNTDAGTYLATAVFTLKDNENYKLTSTTLNKEWSIAKREILKPTVEDHTTVYNASLQALPLTNGTYYSAINHIQTNAGVYTVAFSLNDKDNTVWKDDYSTQDLTFKWTILKSQVETPSYKDSIVYDGKNHNLQIEQSDLYTVLQTSQSAVGEYQTFLVLNDDKNYEWKENTTSPYLSLNWKIVEVENYDNNTPTIAIAFMLSAVILLALYATLHFTSVRRRNKKVATSSAKKAVERSFEVEQKKQQPQKEQILQKEEKITDNKAVEEKNTSNLKEEKQVLNEAKTSTKVENNEKETVVDNEPVAEDIASEEFLNKESKQKKTKQETVEESAEKTRKKRMLSRKKADKKKRKKVVVDDTPKKRGRPKKIEGQQPARKRKTAKTKSSKAKSLK